MHVAWTRWASFTILALSFAAPAAPAHPQSPGTPQASPRLVSDGATRIADPKLDGGGVQIAFHVEPASASLLAAVDVLQGVNVVASVWSGIVVGGDPPTIVDWDGKDDADDWLDTGTYAIRVSAAGARTLELPLDLVRLGVSELEFQDGPVADDEFQMVYFRKNSAYAYFATPAIHEYLNVAEAGEVADLDLDDGGPRPAVTVHLATDAPVMEGSLYDDDRYNYPLAYVMGATPRVEATFGASACSVSGTVMGAGYPVPGLDIRARVRIGGALVSTSEPIEPGETALFDLLPLASRVGREEVEIEWSWEYKAYADTSWVEVPGSTLTPHRFYTLLGTPNFKANATGTQYTGPWVEVCEYLASWNDLLGLDTSGLAGLTELHVKGFFGQNGGIPTAIEGVIYDAYPLGGDGGNTHYFLWAPWNMDLSALLNNHAKGVYVNCTDNMGATTTMLAMMGVDGMRPVRLSQMNLRAIWGIGAPAYTTNLWGGGGHSFSYHHIVTDDDGTTVSDTCMQLDEDGNPGQVPGIPGWNHHRPWAGVGGYDDLSNTNNVNQDLENLPGLK